MITRTINKILKSLNNLPAEYKVALARILTGMIEGIDYLNKEKVDKEEGKGLSTNDFTDELKTKLENVPSEFEQVQGNWNQYDNTKPSYIKGRTHFKNFSYYSYDSFNGIVDNTEFNNIEDFVEYIKSKSIRVFDIDITTLYDYNIDDIDNDDDYIEHLNIIYITIEWDADMDKYYMLIHDDKEIFNIYNEINIENAIDYILSLFYDKDDYGHYWLKQHIIIDNINYDITPFAFDYRRLDTRYLEDNIPTGAYWDSNTKEIKFTHLGKEISQMTISGANFIKDGMVDNVVIENNNLIITFNTDSGKQPIVIPLSDIFNPNDYYTKTQIDDKFVEKIAGKQLSTEDFTTDLKTKLENIEPIEQPDWNENDDTKISYIKNKTHWRERSYNKMEFHYRTTDYEGFDFTNLTDFLNSIKNYTATNIGNIEGILAPYAISYDSELAYWFTIIAERDPDTEPQEFTLNIMFDSKKLYSKLLEDNDNLAEILETELSPYLDYINGQYYPKEKLIIDNIEYTLHDEQYDYHKIDKKYLPDLPPTEFLTPITYSELKTLRNNDELVPGMQYRITDFVTTTRSLSIARSAGHQFDIIVIADTESKLNENARACLHEGDTYFANSKLESWELKYSLDNDTARFNWANNGGKGVIYWMKDEWNNECPYDFKNIQFKRYAISDITSQNETDATEIKNLFVSTDVYYSYKNTNWNMYPFTFIVNNNDFKWYYTFGFEDYSVLSNHVRNNKINSVPVDMVNPFTLPNNIFIISNANYWCTDNILTLSFNNTFHDCSNNIMNSIQQSILKNSTNNKINDASSFNAGSFTNCIFNNSTSIQGINEYNNLYINSNSIFGSHNNSNYFYSSKSIISEHCSRNYFINSERIKIQKQYVSNLFVEFSCNIIITSTQTTSYSNKLKNIKIVGFDTGSNKTISHDTVNDDFQTVYKNVNSKEVIVE